jgi:hypothetical protein
MTASEKKTDHPVCFGSLETVFPMGPDGLRCTPEACMACGHKTGCLRAAMERPAGIGVREEMVDRAYASGRLSFFQRWSRRKTFSRHRNRMKKERK